MPRGRPKGNNKPQVKEITCLSCGKTKKASDFYVSYSVYNAATGRVQYCKECCCNLSCDESGSINIDNFKKLLQKIDKPFLYDVLQSAYEEAKGLNGNSVVGIYFKNINSLPQNRSFSWKDSIFESNNKSDEHQNTPINDFTVTHEVIEKWGDGYQPEEYRAFERKYNLLKNNYTEKTNLHTEALLNYIRYRVKEEIATALNNVKEAKEWGELANKAATAAKINPSQLSKADLSEGLSTFSELSQAVEKEIDIIPILPKFKYRPNDALDFNIWCYVNYMRDLAGLPPCAYEDIYAFYDRRKQEYINQYGDPYGIFSNDTTEKNRENIKKFIKEDGV